MAVTDRPVGVDVELLAPDRMPEWGALTANETATLRQVPQDDRTEVFLRLWTAKEAVLKAEGRDLGHHPASIDAAGVVGADLAEVRGTGGTHWWVRVAVIRPGGAHLVTALADGVGASPVLRSLPG